MNTKSVSQKLVFFSVIIPIKKGARKEFLGRCIKALNNQLYPKYEVIFVTSKQLEPKLLKAINKCKKVKIIYGEYSKTGARNIGAKHAKGNYLLNVDIDYVLPKDILILCKKLIDTQGAEAIILQETVINKKKVWDRARYLERMITKDDSRLSAPQLIKKELLNKIGGYDERIDGLDDWVLFLKLLKIKYILKKLPPVTAVFEPVALKEIWVNRFNKGRYLPLLKKLYKDVPQLSLNKQIRLYIFSFNKLIHNPDAAIALFILKICDTIPFYLGSLFPIIENQHHNLYENNKIAKNFDNENNRTYAALYKDFQEKKVIKKIFDSLNKKDSVLELGAGTGRITSFLTHLGFIVHPTDTSKAMLDVLKGKKYLPKPEIITDSSALPYKKNSFSHIVSLRVIWHIMKKSQRDDFFSEAIRVSKNTILIDFTNKRKYQSPFIKIILGALYPDFFDISYYYTWQEIEVLARKYNLKIEKVFYLEVLPPFIFFFIPRGLVKIAFPFYSNLEKTLSALLQPGRFLIQFKKTI